MQTHNHKSVSIIMASYNRSEFIKRAVESVLRQTYPNLELVVIDGSSDGKTEEVLMPYVERKQLAFIKIENHGPGYARNFGIKNSHGEYIAILDDDDEWIDDEKIEKQVDFLEKNPDYVLVGTWALLRDINEKKIGIYKVPTSDHAIRDRMLSGNCFINSSVVFRRRVLDSTGLYNEENRIEDYLLFLSMGQCGKIHNFNYTSMSLTIHSQSVTSKNRVSQARDIVSILPKWKGLYPNYYRGYAFATLRWLFFAFAVNIPFSKKLIYFVQSVYKKI